MPHLQRFQKIFGPKGLAVFSIGSLSGDAAVRRYVIEQSLAGQEPLFEVLKKGWPVYKAYGGKGTPNTFIIDRRGTVRFIHRTFNPGMEKIMQREIEVLIAES